MRFLHNILPAGLLLLLPSVLAQSTGAGIQLDLSSQQSIKDAASTAAFGLMSWYNGNRTGGVPGLLPGPYHWWESGAMMMTMIEYWFYTRDDSYNKAIIDGIMWQTGPGDDFMTPNQTASTGNDDQAFWGMAVLNAAEFAFPNPPKDKPQWLALAQAVFNTQAARWDKETCGGGLRWQVFTFNAGYHYKNTISNMAFFNIASRLARYTSNETYAEWAVRAWDWQYATGLIGKDFHFFDGADAATNCSEVNHIQWTYNAGIALHGAANMWNHTEDPIWHQRIDRIIEGIGIFVKNNVLVEVACEDVEGATTCNQDQRSFKGYLSRWLAATTQLAPWTHDRLMPWLRASAQGAAKACSGGSKDSAQPGKTCGLKWNSGAWDNQFGPGEQMNAVSIFGANLIDSTPAIVTESKGGISQGDPSAGSGGSDLELSSALRREITMADRVGAGIVTAIILISLIGGSIWMCMEESDVHRLKSAMQSLTGSHSSAGRSSLLLSK